MRLLWPGRVPAIVLVCAWLVALGGCTGVAEGRRAPQARGVPLASIRLTKGAFSGESKGRTGFFFFVEQPTGAGEPVLTGYEYRNGGLLDAFGGGSDSTAVLRAIEAVGLEPFDFLAEVERIEKAANGLRERPEQLTDDQVFLMPPFALDGAQYEIVIETKTGRMVLQEWEPGAAIDFYAPHSPRIAKLKAVLDLLARFYGRAKFGT